MGTTCTVTCVPAADVEGAVLDHIQKLLAAPELVARTWAAARREGVNRHGMGTPDRLAKGTPVRVRWRRPWEWAWIRRGF